MALDNVIAVVLGGGAGTRLYPLTKMRAKPAVPVGGKYRLVDIPVSNCINSELLRIFILTQYNSASLNRHIARTYRFSRFMNGFVEVLAAEITPERSDWFQGTADAVRQSFEHLDDYKCDEILILSGDHLYRMDYRQLLARHWQTGADVTICVTAVGEQDASSFGLVRIGDDGRVVEFREKPKGADLDGIRVDTTRLGLSREEAAERPFLASMGIYVFRKPAIRRLLFDELPRSLDFGKEVLPGALSRVHVQAYLFQDYWEDIGTIASFYRANLALTAPEPAFNFFDAEAPIYTRPRFLPGSQLVDCTISDSIITEGCILDRSTLRSSIVGIRGRIADGVSCDGVLIMGADYYQSADERQLDVKRGLPPVGIGRGSVIRRAIVDKNARIGEGVKILNEAGLDHHDNERYFIRDGIVIVPKNGVIPDGLEI